MTEQQAGEFIIPPEFGEQLRQLAYILPEDEWEKIVNGDRSEVQPLGMLHIECRTMTREEWIVYRQNANG